MKQKATKKTVEQPIEIENVLVDDINTDTLSGEDSVQVEKPKIIGKYKPKTTFHDFISSIKNVNILSKEAILDGKFFDSMRLEGVKFKLTLCDDNTFNLEEIDSNLVSDTEMERYATMFDESGVVGYRDRTIATDFVFTATHTVKDKNLDLQCYLVIDAKKPYNALLEFLSEEDEINQPSEIVNLTDEFDAKLEALFGEDEEVVSNIETPVPNIQEPEPETTSIRQQMAAEFLEAKKDKRAKLEKKINNYKEDLIIAKKAQDTAFIKIRECNEEIKLLASRIDSIGINEPANGYYFFIPESKSNICHLDDATREMISTKLINMNYPNTEAFMTIFNNALFQIRIGLDTDNGLVELTDFKNVLNYFKDFDLDLNSKIYVNNSGLFYEGRLEWSDIGNKLVRLGFTSNHKFDELFAEPVESNEQTDIASEQIAEFEENTGYEIGDEFLFAIAYTESATNLINNPQVCIVITPKSYFDNERYAYDGHIHDILKAKFPAIDALQDLLSEESEGSFTMVKGLNAQHEDINTIIDTMCKAGIKFSTEFQDFISSKDTTLITYILKALGHTSSMI